MSVLRPWSIIALLLCTGIAQAGDKAPLLEGVRARLDAAPVLRGAFEQKKTVKGFSRPLVSSGRFLLVRDQGILWDTEKPFAATLTVTPEVLTAAHGGGDAGYRLEADKEPGVAIVNRLLLALVAGDLQALSSHFEVEGALRGKSAWTLTLTPSSAGLAKVFTSIRLEGAGEVREVELQEQNGDRSVIHFQELRTGPAPTAGEKQRLAP